MATQVLRSALVGCAGIGAMHARAYKPCNNIRLAAVVDVKRETADKLAAEHGVKAYFDVETALQDPNIDVIDVAAPTKFHASIATQAAAAGKHCICEKPIAINADEYQMMAEAFRRSGTTFGGIFQHRFSDDADLLLSKIGTEQLGGNLKGSSVTNWWRDAAYWLAPGRGSYATAGGGVLMVHAIHAIDLIVNLLGEPVCVSASINFTGQPEGVEVENTAIASIEFKTGALARIMASTNIWSPLYPTPSKKMDHMALVETHKIAVTGDKDSWMFKTPPQPLEELFAANLDDFASSAITGKTPIVSGDSAWRTVNLIQRMYESARNGGTRVDI